MSAPKTIRALKTNQQAVISKVIATGEMNRRIRDMGLVPGTSIQVMGRAPLFDPVEIKVKGNKLTLRNNEADFIQVDLGETDK